MEYHWKMDFKKRRDMVGIYISKDPSGSWVNDVSEVDKIEDRKLLQWSRKAMRRA